MLSYFLCRIFEIIKGSLIPFYLMYVNVWISNRAMKKKNGVYLNVYFESIKLNGDEIARMH
jgi:hypothetical protein